MGSVWDKASDNAKGIGVSFYLRFRIIWFLKIGFSPKASGFYLFGDATDLTGEGGVGDVVWLIQASASNHKPKDYLVMIEKNPVGIWCV